MREAVEACYLRSSRIPVKRGCLTACRPPGTGPGGRQTLEPEGALDRVALGALGHGPLGRVVAALHAAQRAALEVDDLPGHDADLRDRGVAGRRTGDLHRAADRVERVADVADGED